MAKKTFKEQFDDFVSDRKKLMLLLLLLGGGAVVTTSVALFSNGPSSSQISGSSVPTSITGSSDVTTSTNPSSSTASSAPLISLDGELPDLNFDNAQIQFDGQSGLSFGFDWTRSSFFNKNYYYVSGSNIFEGLDVTSENQNKSTLGIVVYNLETNEIEHEITLDPGQEYKDAIVNDGLNPLFVNYLSGIEMYQNDLYVMFEGVQVANDTVSLGGDYQKIIDYLYEENITYVNRVLNIMVRFDLTQPGEYDILFALPNNTYKLISSFTFHNDELHILANSQNTFNETIDSLDFFNPLTLTSVPNNGYFISYSIHPMSENGTIGAQRYEKIFYATATGTTYYPRYGRFLAVSEGLTYTYFDNDDNPFVSFNIWMTNNLPTTFETMPDVIDAIDEIQGVSEEDLARAKTSVKAFYDLSGAEEYGFTGQTLSIYFSMTGLYSLETSSFEFIFHSNSFMFFSNNGLNYQSSQYSAFFKAEDTLFISTSYQEYTYGAIAPFTNLLDSENTDVKNTFVTVSSYDTVNKTISELNVPSSDVFNISGIYPRDGGFYMSATLIENESNDIQKTAAVLYRLDESFDVVDALILDGSKTEFSNILTINSLGQLIWILYSSSVDGDFEGAETFNPNGIYKQYIVIF